MNTKHLLRYIQESAPRCLQTWYSERKLSKWEKTGKPIPPPHALKEATIRAYQKYGNYNVFVETGTYYGDMIFAQIDHFKSIYSIELAPYFYRRAVRRFKKCKNVTLLCGDSAIELGNVLKTITEPVIFWLDGHYSGGKTAKGSKDCPIWEELNCIFSLSYPKYKHIILIDDARCFAGQQDYPTIDELARYFTDKNIAHSFEVKDDIIRIVLD